MSTKDATRRAQGWLEDSTPHLPACDCGSTALYYGTHGPISHRAKCARYKGQFPAKDADNSLARLGPPSVGLAVALAIVLDGESMMASDFLRKWGADIAEEFYMRDGGRGRMRDALAEWAQAAGERG